MPTPIRHDLWHVWSSMKQRCYNPNASGYKWYGAKGIKVCDEWHFFSAFVRDMSPRPEGLTLDRINSLGNYTKENCRWADAFTQTANRLKPENPPARGRSGIRGVSEKRPGYFCAIGKAFGETYYLYKGADLEKAKEARLAWEISQKGDL